MDSTAVMGKRIGAYLIDAVISFVIGVVAFVALGESVETGVDLCGIEGSPSLCFYSDGTTYFAEGGNAAAVVLLFYGSWLAFGWLVQGATGGTPGKLIVGLRVVDQATGQLAGFGKCLGRTLMWIVDGIPGIPLVGLISGVASKGHRRVGDMVAKTLVVDKSSVGTAPLVPGLTAPPTAAGYAPPPGGYAPPPPGGYAPTPAAVEPVADGVSAPKWDVDRNAYIQWDPQLNAWMQFDSSSERWVPIS